MRRPDAPEAKALTPTDRAGNALDVRCRRCSTAVVFTREASGLLATCAKCGVIRKRDTFAQPAITSAQRAAKIAISA